MIPLAHAGVEGVYLVLLAAGTGAIAVRRLRGRGFPDMGRRTAWLLLATSVAAAATFALLLLHPSGRR